MNKDTKQIAYKAWFEKYRPFEINDVVFPNEEIKHVINNFYNNEFIRGNVLSYGPPGVGKSTITEVLIKKIIKNPADLFILGRKTEDIDNLKTWLMQQPVQSNQKIVKIEEMDRLSSQAQTVLKDGLMEKFQERVAFLATTNAPEKIDPALLTRFNIRINFKELKPEAVFPRLQFILDSEGIQYNIEDLQKFVNQYYSRGLRDLINNLELASVDRTFNPTLIESFVGTSGNEDLVISYIHYLVKMAETMSDEDLISVLKNANSNEMFFTYYGYMLEIFKNELRLNWHYIYSGLMETDLDMSAKNIIQNYWQDLDLKRFKHTHTLALLHDLLLNIKKMRGVYNDTNSR